MKKNQMILFYLLITSFFILIPLFFLYEMTQMQFSYLGYNTSLFAVYKLSRSSWSTVDIVLMMVLVAVLASNLIIKIKKNVLWPLRLSFLFISWIGRSTFVMPFLYLYYQMKDSYYYYWSIGFNMAMSNDALYNSLNVDSSGMNEVFLQIGHDSLINPHFMALIYGMIVYYVIALFLLIALPLISSIKYRKQLS